MDSLADNAARPEVPENNESEIMIRPFLAGRDDLTFRLLNEECIQRHFTLEDKDRETLGDHERTILQKGDYLHGVRE